MGAGLGPSTPWDGMGAAGTGDPCGYGYLPAALGAYGLPPVNPWLISQWAQVYNR